MKKILISLAFLFLYFNSYSAIIYVDVNATGANNGTSWDDAYTNLQTAISVAFVNDDIWIATGVYKPTATTSRSVSFVMRNGVDMFGGFDGTETAINQRNISANPTTLSGDIGALGDNTDNTYRIIKIENFTASFTLDGFRVVSGYNATSTSNGAGMFISDNPGPQITVRNTTFYNNFVDDEGAAVFVEASNVNFYNCEFLYNSTSTAGRGGAVFTSIVSDATLRFADTRFIGNFARDGVVIFFNGGGELFMDRVLVTNNTTSNLASSHNIITVNTDAEHFEMNNSLVAGNQIFSGDGSVIASYTTTPNASSLTNLTICHNKNSYPVASTREMVYHSTNAPATLMAINNCIVYGNTPSDLNTQVNLGGNIVANSVIENGYVGGTNISTSNPAFVNPSALASAPFDVSSFDYSLLAASPAVNYGNNTYALPFSVDYMNNPRIQQGIVDCGAIESPFTDVIPPVANCANLTVYLDAAGIAVIDSSDVDNGSTDNLGIVSAIISETTFDCSDVGENPITLIVADAAGNTDTCMATITVVDSLDPTILAQNISIYLDASGNAGITAEDIDTGTTDNCGLDTIYVSQTDFTCSDAGPNTITFTAVDINGNSASVTRTVTVIDSVFPTAVAQNITLYLNANGNATFTAIQINNGSSDDCSIAGMTVTPTSYNCNGTGVHTATLTVIDNYGNSSTANASVTVLDTITPVTIGHDITVDLGISNPYVITAANLNNGSDDNCSFTQSIDINSFNAAGVYDVTLTTTDGSGNSSNGVYQVTVLPSVVGVKENFASLMSVSPNPTTGEVHVQLSAAANQLKARIVDISGKVVCENVFLQVSSFDLTFEGAPGFYILEICASGNEWSKTKIMKSN